MLENVLSVPLTVAEQNAFALALHVRLGEQVKRYHKRYHRSENTSVPTETAQALMQSIFFTLGVTGGYRPNISLDEQLQTGQKMLEATLEKARATHALLLTATPICQSEWRWDALRALGRYLDRYDAELFAHVSPEIPVYPLLIGIPDTLSGIFVAQAYLGAFFVEEQILDALTGAQALLEDAPPLYWDAPQSIVEQPLCNALAKTLLHAPLDPLLLSQEEKRALLSLLSGGDVEETLRRALDTLSEHLHFTAPMREYADGAVRLLSAQVADGASMERLDKSFW